MIQSLVSLALLASWPLDSAKTSPLRGYSGALLDEIPSLYLPFSLSAHGKDNYYSSKPRNRAGRLESFVDRKQLGHPG